MGTRLQTEVTTLGDVCHIKLAGVVDEDNDLSALSAQIDKNVVLISTADVERINSCGVRDWVTWLGELEQKGVSVYLMECSPAIMSQVNLVNNFVGHGTIVSFFAPYFCPPPCEADKMLLIDTREALKQKPFHAPACRCDECDRLMEFDDIESSYFGFLGHTKAFEIPPSVEQAISRVSNTEGRLLRSRSSASIPIAALNTNVTPSTPSSGHTTPSARDLKGLLDEVSAVPTPPKPAQQPSSNKLIYAILGLLVVAIGLLAYALLR